MKGLIPVTIYMDATPHSVAALIPTLKLSCSQAFHVSDEINRAEAIAVLLGLQWASADFLDCPCTVYCDDAAVVVTLTKGTGHLWRHHGLRRLYLTPLHGLRGNTFFIKHVQSSSILTDRLSRAVLQTLH